MTKIAPKIKPFVYDSIKHLTIAKRYLKDGKDLKTLCRRLHIDLKILQKAAKENQDFGFIVQRIASYSYIPETEMTYHVEVPWISKFNPETHIPQLINLYKEGKTPAQICAVLKIARSTYDNWRATYKVFEDAHQYGKQCFQAYWEDIMSKGIRGEIPGFSAATISFFLRNQFRDDYADVKNINTNTSNTLAVLTDADLQKRLLAKLSETKLLEKAPFMGNTFDSEPIANVIVEEDNRDDTTNTD